jgi:hypothetical protein
MASVRNGPEAVTPAEHPQQVEQPLSVDLRAIAARWRSRSDASNCFIVGGSTRTSTDTPEEEGRMRREGCKY